MPLSSPIKHADQNLDFDYKCLFKRQLQVGYFINRSTVIDLHNDLDILIFYTTAINGDDVSRFSD